MKRNIAKQNYYKLLLHVMHKYEGVFEGKQELQSIKTDFEFRVQRISEILSDISRPVSIFYSPKRYAEEKLNYTMKIMSGMGCMAASINDDATMLKVMQAYIAQLNKVSAYRLFVNARHVADLLKNVHVDIVGRDFLDKKLPAFRQQVQSFGTILDLLSDRLRRRKALKIELAQLIAGTNLFLRNETDAIVRFNAAEYPDFYREYLLIRYKQRRKRSLAGKSQPEMKTANNDNCAMHPALVKPLKPQMPITNSLPLNPIQETMFAVKRDEETLDVAENEILKEYLAGNSLSHLQTVCRSLCSEEVSVN